jgi:hypothetical protein
MGRQHRRRAARRRRERTRFQRAGNHRRRRRETVHAERTASRNTRLRGDGHEARRPSHASYFDPGEYRIKISRRSTTRAGTSHTNAREYLVRRILQLLRWIRDRLAVGQVSPPAAAVARTPCSRSGSARSTTISVSSPIDWPKPRRKSIGTPTTSATSAPLRPLPLRISRRTRCTSRLGHSVPHHLRWRVPSLLAQGTQGPFATPAPFRRRAWARDAQAPVPGQRRERLEVPRVLAHVPFMGATALVLKVAPYPSGGINGDHVVLVWNESGSGYLMSFHYARDNASLAPTQHDVQDLMRAARSMTPL